MEYYIINTDWDARKDLITCDLWFKYGMAFTGNRDDEDKRKKFKGKILARFRPNDILLMYHNLTDKREHSKKGVVGIGKVLEIWDSKIYTDSDRLLYRREKYEYRIAVNWFIDWRQNPKDAKTDLKLFTASQTCARIDKEKYQIENRLSSLIMINRNKEINQETEKYNSSLAEEAYYRESPENLHLIIRRHNKLSNVFIKWLNDNGFSFVKQEKNNVDVSFQRNNKTFLAELKICHNVGTTKSIREALGQLLEYNYYSGRYAADYWVIVLDEKPTRNDIEYLRTLRKKLNLPLSLCWKFKNQFEFAKDLEII